MRLLDFVFMLAALIAPFGLIAFVAYYLRGRAKILKIANKIAGR